MIESMCQSYHWTLDEAMRLTVPQIIMLGHAANVNFKRSGMDKHSSLTSSAASDDFVEVNGRSKRLSEMTSEDYTLYYSDWG